MLKVGELCCKISADLEALDILNIMNLVWCSPVTNGDHCYKNHSCFLFKLLD